MANTLDPMDLKQIITLHRDGESNRSIGSTLGISRNTVNHYMKLIRACEYPLDKLVKLDYDALDKLFPSYSTIDADRHNEVLKHFESINKARNHPGFTFLHHYSLYTDASKNPYSYTQFMVHYRRKYAKIRGSMKL